MSLSRRLLAEFLATALLLAVVIGSGVMGAQLAGGNVAIALLANTLATVGGLYFLITVFGPVSAHMNPAVSVVLATRGLLPAGELVAYLGAQFSGAVAGAWLAHSMFSLPLLQIASTPRSGAGLWLAEVVATAGLLLVVLRVPTARVAATVAIYIGAAYWFTASTAFANPAATLGRMLSDSFAGIAPASVLPFLLAQALGATLGSVLDRLLGVPACEPTP
jgi:glycerol uptake facilitator-like aquaporin